MPVTVRDRRRWHPAEIVLLPDGMRAAIQPQRSRDIPLV